MITSTAIARPMVWLAGPRRAQYTLRNLPRSSRTYSTAPKPEQPVIPSISELISKESIKKAWAELSTIKKLMFGGLVIAGGVGEYQVLKKFLLDPVKERKRLKEAEQEARVKLVAAGGEDKSVLLQSS